MHGFYDYTYNLNFFNSLFLGQYYCLEKIWFEDENEDNPKKNPVADEYKGKRRTKVLWKNAVKDWYIWERTMKVEVCKRKNGG